MRRMPPTQAVELQHERLVFLRRGAAVSGVWLLAGRIDAQPMIAELRRHNLQTRQRARIARVGKLKTHAGPYCHSSLLPHPRVRTHASWPIRQITRTRDAQRVPLLLPVLDPAVFFFWRRQRENLVDG